MHSRESTDRVVVVGAGVSGCACAVALAEAGVAVTLVNSALDVVGLPGYGPDLWLTDRDAWALVPQRLREAWERWSYVPDAVASLPTDAVGVIVTDCRAASLETKRLIESLPQIDLRQGLVIDIRPSVDRSADVEVETAFGDVVRGAACVLAVGLGLGGRMTERGRETAGARYGEVAADALFEVLRDRGTLFATVERSVGDRVLGWEPGRVAGEEPLGRALLLRRASAREVTATGMPGEGLVMPPGPHELVRARLVAAWTTGDGEAVGSSSSVAGAGIFPDEAATGEWYRSLGFEGGADAERSLPNRAGVQVVREAYRVCGQMILSLDPDGRLQGHRRTWVIGQAAGARTYLESLAGGVRGALAVAAALSASATADRPIPCRDFRALVDGNVVDGGGGRGPGHDGAPGGGAVDGGTSVPKDSRR